MLHTVFRHELLPAEIFNFSNFESFVARNVRQSTRVLLKTLHFPSEVIVSLV